ncbi:hypothetical protein CPB84DRAFT_1798306 [Gymnopilus junonius]|uniref:Uncharacterized protein n=1 Tax=Gymnopilus junonius TaxID=109634 RepID=A0A9P5N939_GYMJU|nr:hypothetical protein CPB84DRAFT_1798306 [Gymnopilus junonius]
MAVLMSELISPFQLIVLMKVRVQMHSPKPLLQVILEPVCRHLSRPRRFVDKFRRFPFQKLPHGITECQVHHLRVLPLLLMLQPFLHSIAVEKSNTPRFIGVLRVRSGFFTASGLALGSARFFVLLLGRRVGISRPLVVLSRGRHCRGKFNEPVGRSTVRGVK